jgi:hypothetical protein
LYLHYTYFYYTGLEEADSFTADIIHPERNKSGFIVIRAQNITVGNECLDGLAIFKPLYDPRDILEPKNFKLELLPGRNGVAIKEPSLPYYFLHGAKDVIEVENKYDGECNATGMEHQMQATSIKKDPARHTKTTVIYFPNGMKGNVDYFNKKFEKYNQKSAIKMVVPNGRFLPQKVELKEGSIMNWYAPYVWWKVAIDGTVRETSEAAVANIDDIFVDALKSMNI